MQMTISINGDVQLSRNLRVFVDSLNNMAPFYQDAIDIVKERGDSIFSAQWSNVEKWPKRKPLSASTQKARLNRRWYYKNSPSNPGILRWTGRLQTDITTRANDRFWSLEYNAPYAPYHQSGWWNLPRRPFLDLSNEVNTRLLKKLQEKIQKDIGIFGLQA